MKGFTLKEILLLSASVGFLMIWVGEIISGRVNWRESYFWLMFSVFTLLGFQYYKNQRVMREKSQTPPAPEAKPRKKK